MSYLIPFIILITVVVFIHEYGHYYIAKKYGVGVTDFSIGFGREIFGWNDKSGTRWKICWIPLGGYVKFFGDRNVFSQTEQAEVLKPITSFIKKMDCIPGFQLAHAGRKAGTRTPWMGGAPLDQEDIDKGNAPWPTVAPSDIPVTDGWVVPKAMDSSDISDVISAFADAASRAVNAGFKVIEIHSAHGYLLHSFLSPLLNKRKLPRHFFSFCQSLTT